MVRFGEKRDIKITRRERPFVQKVGVGFIYFKEFGASRDINRKTGEWVPSNTLSIYERGNEVLHFKVHEAANSPYGVPRWICETPSVVGTRNAEIMNNDFFDSGGVPPVIVFLKGGAIEDQVRSQLTNIFNAGGAKNTRGAVVSVTPFGSIDKEGKAEVQVERFGDTSKSSTMFTDYIQQGSEWIRMSFRLPPLFLGRVDGYTYASVYASYLVAEEQVFGPERKAFDDYFNITIMRAIDPAGEYTIESNAISIKDTEVQLRGIEMLNAIAGVNRKEVVDAINAVTGLGIAYEEEELDPDTL